ncbi:MAG: hypothetical protein FWE50_04315 [Alphaproteobacteria bacterium]|nr:hypothetical protein [Alphaproteobacteria bacterium]
MFIIARKNYVVAHKPMYCSEDTTRGFEGNPIWLVSYFIEYKFPGTRFIASHEVVKKFKEDEKEKVFKFYRKTRNKTEYWKRNKHEIEPITENMTPEYIENLRLKKIRIENAR